MPSSRQICPRFLPCASLASASRTNPTICSSVNCFPVIRLFPTSAFASRRDTGQPHHLPGSEQSMPCIRTAMTPSGPTLPFEIILQCPDDQFLAGVDKMGVAPVGGLIKISAESLHEGIPLRVTPQGLLLGRSVPVARVRLLCPPRNLSPYSPKKTAKTIR